MADAVSREGQDHVSPIVFGVDVARFGDDASVIAIRRGRDGQSLPWKTFRNVDPKQQGALEMATLPNVASTSQPGRLDVQEPEAVLVRVLDFAGEEDRAGAGGQRGQAAVCDAVATMIQPTFAACAATTASGIETWPRS